MVLYTTTTMAARIVHIDEVTDSGPVSTTTNPRSWDRGFQSAKKLRFFDAKEDGLRSSEILTNFRGAFAKLQFVKGSRFATLVAQRATKPGRRPDW